MKLRCKLRFHTMREWSLPQDLAKGLDGRGWSWTARRCIYCPHSSVSMVRVAQEEHRG